MVLLYMVQVMKSLILVLRSVTPGESATSAKDFADKLKAAVTSSNGAGATMASVAAIRQIIHYVHP